MTIRNSESKIHRRRRGRYSFLGHLAAITGFALAALMIFAVLVTLVDAAPVREDGTHQFDDHIAHDLSTIGLAPQEMPIRTSNALIARQDVAGREGVNSNQ